MSETNHTPLERAKSLLEVHGGICSVRDDSDIGRAFREMEKAGEVEITLMPSTPGVYGYIRIERKVFPL